MVGYSSSLLSLLSFIMTLVCILVATATATAATADKRETGPMH